jgi:hypothetical protein
MADPQIITTLTRKRDEIEAAIVVGIAGDESTER